MAIAIDRRDRDIIVLVVALVSVFATVLATKDILAFRVSSYLSNLILFGCVIASWLAMRTLKIVFIDRPAALSKTIIASEFNAVQFKKLSNAAPVLLCLIIFMPAFSAMKSAIPLFNDYSWDGYFISADRQIHGNDPWRVLQPLLGHPLITSITSVFYHLWILLIYVGGSFFAFRHDEPVQRQRFFLSYFLAWAIIGVLLATTFASVGPVFVEPMLGRDDFVPLMQYLQQSDRQYPVMVLEVQNSLLAWHQSGDHGLGRGITAMPSMHVSLAFLFFLAMRHVSRIAAWASGIFLVIILIGSVHLAYHYAVDGYVSVIVTAIIWKLAGLWVAKSETDISVLHPSLAADHH
jgi:hypothetical protein